MVGDKIRGGGPPPYMARPGQISLVWSSANAVTMVGNKIRGVAPPSPGEAWSDLLVWGSGDTIAAFSDTPGMFMRSIVISCETSDV